MDSSFFKDAVVLRKVASPDYNDEITVMFKDGSISDHTWRSVKSAMNYIQQGNYKGAEVIGFPSRKVFFGALAPGKTCPRSGWQRKDVTRV